MRVPRIGLVLAIIAFGFSACENDGRPVDKTGGAAGLSSSAGGSAGTAGTTSAGGDATSGMTSASGGVAGTGGSNSASGGATSTADTTGTGGSTSTGEVSSATGGTTATGNMTSASGGATGGTAGASSSAGGAMGGTGGATSGARADAGADTGVGGAGGLLDAGRDASSASDLPGDTSFRPDSTVDRASDAIASNCTCLGKPAPTCTPTGHLTYALSRAASPTADQADAYNQITCAMDMAIAYYNCYADITGSVRVSYDTSVSTADGNINGSIRFGVGRQYMLCATAMHEIAHTQGIGTAAQWPAHVSNGLLVGTNTAAQLQAINATLTTPLDTVIHADSMHFWPYGLNYETEATGTDILVDHCKIVVAIRKDLGLQP